jgi:hypothetical protein
MVCFTQHIFRFNQTNGENWFNLLCKYYPQVEITATLTNSRSDETWQVKGTICMDFFQNEMKGRWTECEIQTERFWAEKASIRCMPAYVPLRLPEPINTSNNTKGIIETANAIDGVIEQRLGMGGREVFISHNCMVNNFDDLLRAFYLIRFTNKITRLYISHQSELIIFVLNDRHTIVASCDEVGDSTTPVFDVDDGFMPNVFDAGVCVDEWNEYFQAWLSDFKNTNGATWDNPVI